MHDREPLSLDGAAELVVIAPHPDDETLGAGGLIAECSRRGIPTTVVFVTDGAASEVPGIATRRAEEARAALAILGAKAVFLGVPDGTTRENRETIASLLRPLLAATPRETLIASPWRGDGHRDHRVVGEVVAELAGVRRVLEYPIWLWHWGTPADVPWGTVRVLPIDDDTKRRALAEYSSQTEGESPMLRADFLEHFVGPNEYFFEQPRSLGADYFDDTYSRHDDPWGFETRWYEERKRALTLAALPHTRYADAFEIGCSIGVLTEGLAKRSGTLLAVDISQSAVDRAAARVPSAIVERRNVLDDFPTGSFDLVVLSEVGYYFDRPGLATVLDNIRASLTDDGVLVACHWRHGVTDYPLTGDEVHAAIRELDLALIAEHVEKDFLLEVYCVDPRSVAERSGLA